jgi:hypothetical protein
MRPFILGILVLLGGATSTLQAQDGNSFGIRLGSFDPSFSSYRTQNGTSRSFAAGMNVQVVKDWAREGQGFWRGRLGLGFSASKSPLSNPNAYTTNNAFSTSIWLGRGRRIEFAPFALSYGGEFGIGMQPYNQSKSYFAYGDAFSSYETSSTIQQPSASLNAGVFLQLDWNIHRNIWIGIEQRLYASVNYSQESYESVYAITQNGGTTTTVENRNTNSWSFGNPFYIPTPLFSLTFRPGGN